MGTGQRTYKARHLRAVKSIRPIRTLNETREKDQKLHKNSTWVNFRKRFLKENKKCYCCGEDAQAVDHIIPSKGRLEVFERTGNHLALCNVCHNTITGKFDYKYSESNPNTSEKLNWIAETRARNEIRIGVKFKPAMVVKYKE